MNTIAPAHVASSGPYRSNVIVAPATGFTRPLTVALSVICPPNDTSGDALVAIDGCARATVAGGLDVPRADAVVAGEPPVCVLSTICTVWSPGVTGW